MFCFYFLVRQLLNKYLTKSKTDKDKAATYTLKTSVVTLIKTVSEFLQVHTSCTAMSCLIWYVFFPVGTTTIYLTVVCKNYCLCGLITGTYY